MADSTQSFQELILRAQSGDRDALDTLYRLHVTPLYRFVLVRLRNREDAEDVVQETFLRAYQAIGRYKVRGENFLPYLYTIARNLLINHVKKKRPETMSFEQVAREAAGEQTSQFAEARELRSALVEAMSVLGEEEREVVELRFFAERTYAEIASILDKHPDAIRQHVARAMKKMRKQMDQFV